MPSDREWTSLRTWIDNLDDGQIHRAQLSRQTLILGYKYIVDRKCLWEDRKWVEGRHCDGANSNVVNVRRRELDSREMDAKIAWKEYERNLANSVEQFARLFPDIRNEPTHRLQNTLEIMVRDLRRNMPSEEQRRRQREHSDELLADQFGLIALSEATQGDEEMAKQLAEQLGDESEPPYPWY